MHDLPPQSRPPSGPRPPRRTARLRLTILYGAVCLVFGAILLTVTYLLTWGTVPGEVVMATPRATAASSQGSVGPSAQQQNLQPQNGDWEIAVDRRLLLARSGIALIIVSAGFDAHRRDPLAQLRLETEDFAWISRELLAVADRHTGGKLVSSLEGGYDLEALADATAAHVRVLMRQ